MKDFKVKDQMVMEGISKQHIRQEAFFCHLLLLFLIITGLCRMNFTPMVGLSTWSCAVLS